MISIQAHGDQNSASNDPVACRISSQMNYRTRTGRSAGRYCTVLIIGFGCQRLIPGGSRSPEKAVGRRLQGILILKNKRKLSFIKEKFWGKKILQCNQPVLLNR